MYNIKFKYRDRLSNWEWREQEKNQKISMKY